MSQVYAASLVINLPQVFTVFCGTVSSVEKQKTFLATSYRTWADITYLQINNSNWTKKNLWCF